MTDDLARLLDLPAAARLAVADGELALLTITHEHADKITIERRRLGTSIDLGYLLQVIGSHGIDTSQLRMADLQVGAGIGLRVTEVPAPQLPAPEVEVSTDPPGTACLICERSFKSQHALTTHMAMKHKAPPAGVECTICSRTFKNSHALEVHQGRAHKQVQVAAPETAVEPAPSPEPEPEPIAERPAAPTVPLKPVYTCSTCGTSLELHERCADCQALLGPEHDAGEAYLTVNGKSLCRTCTAYRGTARTVLGIPA